jgi:hypothetical protein
VCYLTRTTHVLTTRSAPRLVEAPTNAYFESEANLEIAGLIKGSPVAAYGTIEC